MFNWFLKVKRLPMRLKMHYIVLEDHVDSCEDKNNSIHYGIYLRNEFVFWNVHEIMNTSGLLQSKRSFTLTLQET